MLGDISLVLCLFDQTLVKVNFNAKTNHHVLTQDQPLVLFQNDFLIINAYQLNNILIKEPQRNVISNNLTNILFENIQINKL
jgi:hypothetical protein